MIDFSAAYIQETWDQNDQNELWGDLNQEVAGGEISENLRVIATTSTSDKHKNLIVWEFFHIHKEPRNDPIFKEYLDHVILEHQENHSFCPMCKKIFPPFDRLVLTARLWMFKNGK